MWILHWEEDRVKGVGPASPPPSSPGWAEITIMIESSLCQSMYSLVCGWGLIYVLICGQVVACCQRFSMVLDSKLGCEAYLVYPEVEITSDVKGEEAKGRTFSKYYTRS